MSGYGECTVYPKKYAHGFCFAVLCCGYTLTDFPISIRLTSLALWQSNDCPSASKATLMNMDKYFMWIHYERLHNHNKTKHNKTVCIFLGIYCKLYTQYVWCLQSVGHFRAVEIKLVVQWTCPFKKQAIVVKGCFPPVVKTLLPGFTALCTFKCLSNWYLYAAVKEQKGTSMLMTSSWDERFQATLTPAWSHGSTFQMCYKVAVWKSQLKLLFIVDEYVWSFYPLKRSIRSGIGIPIINLRHYGVLRAKWYHRLF